MILTAQSIGESAKKCIEQSQQFRVHSIFQKGFNLVNAKDELIFVGTTENGVFPFGIVVDAWTRDHLLQAIKVDQALTIQRDRLQIRKDLHLNLNVELLKTPTQFDQVNLAQLRESLLHFDFNEYHEGDFSLDKMQAIVQALSDDQIDAIPALKYLIGRGQGLTPSGDDMLVGMLFLHFVQPFITKKHMQEIEMMLKTPITTLVSQTFLNHAIHGIFSSKLTNLMKSANQSTLKQLQNVGSSSGKDTLYGMAIVLLKE